MALLRNVMLSAPLFAAIASAQTTALEFTSFPPENTTLEVPFVVNWQAPNNEVVTIVLLKGPTPSLLQPLSTLAITSGSSFTWIPNAAPTSFYGLYINDATTSNYGNHFTLVAPAQQPASGVGGGAAPVTTSSTPSTPTTGTSSFTVSPSTTTGPVVIAPGPAVTSPTTTLSSSVTSSNFVTNLPSITSSSSLYGNYSATTVTVEDCSCTDMDMSSTLSTSVTAGPWTNGTATIPLAATAAAATPASNSTISMATIPATTAGLVASSTWTVVPATGGAVSHAGGCGAAVLGGAMMVAVAAMW